MLYRSDSRQMRQCHAELDRCKKFPALGCLLALLIVSGCGGGGSSSPSTPVPSAEILSVIVNPQTAFVLTGSGQTFNVAVVGSGSYDSTVTWSVNSVVGGNGTLGTIVPTPQRKTVTGTGFKSNGISAPPYRLTARNGKLCGVERG